MSKTSHINEIMQNLNTLSLAELLVLRSKVDALIQDNSLEKVIGLVNEWMTDESDDDEETYSSIKPALNRNQPSL